ncbi:YfiR family protein [Steroidobacter sp. S1-65]|uniref:YfiR family protein n=1 Tax=Steroidobacter gossypii TaxID=2805490 RepID=A0ABS1X472_9GAMM|nr:YfiR family protein [Steroidobacter gossypii]MBM0108021.1 YfiR family protein [Steroidobacter gossypii]
MSFHLHILSALAALMATAMSARADAVLQRETQFKAAYLFNFAKFVEWPAGVATDTVTICFIGGAGVYQELASGIENKRVGSRRLVALQLTDSQAADACNAVYVEAPLPASINSFAGRPVLTVSNAADFAANGGMIELFTENHRLRFLINVESAERVGLRISSDLLKLAAGVRRKPR